MDKEAFIKVPRSFFDSDEWNKKRVFSEFEAKLYLLQRARYGSKSTEFTNHKNGRKVTIHNGQMLATNSYLMKAWHWKKTRVQTFLKRLIKQDFIKIDVKEAGSIITVIENQPPNQPPKGKKSTTKRTTEPTTETHINKGFQQKEQPPKQPLIQPPATKKTTTKTAQREESNKEESILKEEHNEFDNSQGHEEIQKPINDGQTEHGEGCAAKQQITEIVNFLNNEAGRSFRVTTKETIDLVTARINEGYTVRDFKAVIRAKVKQWANDTKRARWLRPSTLFKQPNFENYLQESKIKTDVRAKHKTDFDRYAEHY